MTPRQFLAFIAQVRGFTAPRPKQNGGRGGQDGSSSPCSSSPSTRFQGFKRRVGLAQAILHDPPTLVMDEPTEVLIPIRSTACAS